MIKGFTMAQRGFRARALFWRVVLTTKDDLGHVMLLLATAAAAGAGGAFTTALSTPDQYVRRGRVVPAGVPLLETMGWAALGAFGGTLLVSVVTAAIVLLVYLRRGDRRWETKQALSRQVGPHEIQQWYHLRPHPEATIGALVVTECWIEDPVGGIHIATAEQWPGGGHYRASEREIDKMNGTFKVRWYGRPNTRVIELTRGKYNGWEGALSEWGRDWDINNLGRWHTSPLPEP